MSTHRSFPSSRCNNVLYIISGLFPYYRPYILTCSISTEKPLRNNNVCKNLQKASPSQFIFQAKGTLETRCLCAVRALLRFGTLACISAPECTRHCIYRLSQNHNDCSSTCEKARNSHFSRVSVCRTSHWSRHSTAPRVPHVDCTLYSI